MKANDNNNNNNNHDANNVSNFGGDPVTQINLKKLFIVLFCPSGDMSPYCSAHDEWLIMKLCMHVGYHDANNVYYIVLFTLF